VESLSDGVIAEAVKTKVESKIHWFKIKLLHVKTHVLDLNLPRTDPRGS
jgi:hypothetical protein